MTAVLGPRHPQVLVGRGHHALVRASLGDRAADMDGLETLVADLRSVLGPGHPFVATAKDHLLAIANDPAGVSGRPPAPGDPWIVTRRYASRTPHTGA